MSLVPADKGEIRENALILKPGISYEEWAGIAKSLAAMQKGLLFWVGDWLQYGEASYGEMYAQAAEDTGYSPATLRQCKYIAAKFPPEVRDDRLTFNHYAAVAGADNALELLSEAAEQEMSVADLRQRRKRESGQQQGKDDDYKWDLGEVRTLVEMAYKDGWHDGAMGRDDKDMIGDWELSETYREWFGDKDDQV